MLREAEERFRANKQQALDDILAESRQKKETLEQGTSIVSQTDESFRKITAAAEGAVDVQNQISGVITSSQGDLQVLCQFFDQIKDQYHEVVKHIDRASRLGTTKSAMFEFMDNMISKIPPLVKDLESGR